MVDRGPRLACRRADRHRRRARRRGRLRLRRWLPADGALPGLVVAGGLQTAREPLGGWLERRRRVSSRPRSLPRHSRRLRTDHARTRWASSSTWPRPCAACANTRSRVPSARGSIGHVRRGSAWRSSTRPGRFDPARAKAVLERLAPSVRREPVDARLDLVGHQRIDDQPGGELDIEATLNAIEEGEREELAVFPVKTKRDPRARDAARCCSPSTSPRCSRASKRSSRGTGGGARATSSARRSCSTEP